MGHAVPGKSKVRSSGSLAVNIPPGLLSVAAVLLIWEFLAQLEISYAFPSILEIGRAWFVLYQRGDLQMNLLISAQQLALGFAFGAGLGLITGTGMAVNDYIQAMLRPYIDAFLSAPLIAFVPLMVALFGFGPEPIIGTVFLYTFFVICVNTETGVRNVDEGLIEMARSYGASSLKLIIRILLPGASGLIVGGIKLAMGRAIQGVITGQLLIALSGLGGLLIEFGRAFKTDYLYAVLLTVVIISWCFLELFERLEQSFLKWRQLPM